MQQHGWTQEILIPSEVSHKRRNIMISLMYGI